MTPREIAENVWLTAAGCALGCLAVSALVVRAVWRPEKTLLWDAEGPSPTARGPQKRPSKIHRILN